MRSHVDWCAECQIDWVQADSLAHSLEVHCRNKPCPFKDRLNRRRNEIGKIFELIVPENVFEGSDLKLYWRYKGNLPLEWLQLEGYRKQLRNPLLLKARKGMILSFRIKMTGYGDVIRESFAPKILALPKIVLDHMPTIVPKGKSVNIRAQLVDCSRAIIQFPQIGRSFQFTGSFQTEALNDRCEFIIKAFGALDSIVEKRHSISVFQPPILHRFSLKDNIMPRDKIVILFETDFAKYGEIHYRKSNSSDWRKDRLDADQLAKKIYKMKLPAGEWLMKLALFGENESIVQSEASNLIAKEFKSIQILKGLLAVLGVLMALACIGGFLYWIWPVLEFLFDIIIGILVFIWFMVTSPWTYVIGFFVYLWDPLELW